MHQSPERRTARHPFFVGVAATLYLASSTPPPSLGLTLGESLTRCLFTDAALLEADQRVKSAEVDRERSAALFPSNPYVGTSVSSSTYSQTVPDESHPSGVSTLRAGPAFSFYFEQEVDIAGQRGIRMKSARHGVEVARFNRAHAERSAISRTRVAFAEAQVERDLAKVEEESLHWEQEMLRTIRSEGDGAGQLSRASAEVRVWRARRERQLAERRHDSAIRALMEGLRLPPGEPVVVDGDLPSAFPAESRSFEDLVASARRHRQDRLAHEELVRWSEAHLELERRGWVPSVTFSAFVSHEDGDQQYGGGIGFPLPVFQSPGVEVQGAIVDLDRARTDLAVLDDRIAAEVKAALAMQHAAARDATMLQDEILPRLTKIAEMRDRAFDVGKSSGAALVDAQLDLLDARRDFITAQGAYAVAAAELDRATGAPVDPVAKTSVDSAPASAADSQEQDPEK